jgi:hypothetical protein
MIDKLLNFINYLLDAINAVPVHVWFIVGVVAASLPVTVGIVQWVKHRHFKKTGLEMENHLIDYTVTVTAALMTLTDFLITNGTQFANLFPFLLVVLPTIKAFAPTVFSISKAIHTAAIERKNKQPITTPPELPALIQQITTPPSSSFGTESTGRSTDLLI